LLSFEQGENKKPAFLAVNPMGKLPAIVHRGTVVTECGAIITYLGDAFPAAKLAPAIDDHARGTYLRWMFFGLGCIESALIDRMLSRPPVDRPTALGYGNYDDVVHAIEKALTPGPYILVNRFSAADVYVGSQVHRVPRALFSTLAASRAASLAAWQPRKSGNGRLRSCGFALYGVVRIVLRLSKSRVGDEFAVGQAP
jgi:glutathione S-transferase